MNTVDEKYVSLLKDIKEKGYICEPARKNMPATKALFGEKLEFNNSIYPLLQGKKVSFKNVLIELLWFLKGDSNIKFLVENNCNIWNKDAYRYYKDKFEGKLSLEEFEKAILDNSFEGGLAISNPNDNVKDSNYKYGDCGKIYPSQWRSFGKGNFEYQKIGFHVEAVLRKSIDQIKKLIEGLRDNPYSRYHIVDAWNIQDFEEGKQALPACHTNFMCNVFKHNDGKFYLDLAYRQRSCDTPLGVPYDIASYALLQRILSKLVGYEVGKLICYLDNVHYYENQQEYVDEYIQRFEDNEIPNENVQVEINSSKWMGNIDNIKIEDFNLINYKPLSTIKAPLSVGL